MSHGRGPHPSSRVYRRGLDSRNGGKVAGQRFSYNSPNRAPGETRLACLRSPHTERTGRPLDPQRSRCRFPGRRQHRWLRRPVNRHIWSESAGKRRWQRAANRCAVLVVDELIHPAKAVKTVDKLTVLKGYRQRDGEEGVFLGNDGIHAIKELIEPEAVARRDWNDIRRELKTRGELIQRCLRASS
ncbi:MAG: hypothetical protein KatS3mg059_1120 [Thermomicrobiales bacterium]|nr:MAG: hypothetical protein KatS3mg059_1120 [Thermomicrobiales bacterium]